MKILMTKKFDTMKMKIFLSSLIIGIVLTGCSDFLNQNPESFTSSSTFYKNKSQIDEALNGAYSGLQTLYGASLGGNAPSSAFWAMTEERSDNTTFEYNNANRGFLQREDIDYFLVTPDNNFTQGVWQDIYSGIEQCNTILDRIDNVDLSSADHDQIVGQTEFIRALYYFNLVRLWGNVPLLTKAITSPDQTDKIEQAKPSAVYQQIISDAKDAASKLPATWSASNAGRVTKGAAHTLLGEVYMTMDQPGNTDNYNKAIAEFKKVIQSGTYSLMSNYSALWDPQNKNNSESVFEIQYSSSTQASYSSYIYEFAPLFSGYTTIGSFSPSSGDGRNIPTRNMLGTYENGDQRKDASIAWFVDPDVNTNPPYYEVQHDSLAYVQKYAAKPSEQFKQNVDFYVYRYAQVLLWYAEALNEVGKTSQAYSYVNKVRKRAGLNGLTTGMSQSQFRTAVYHEERVESAFEDHRWFQLIRTGRAVNVMNANGTEQKTYQTWLSPASYDVQKYKLLYPLPIHDTQLNANLKQNPGW